MIVYPNAKINLGLFVTEKRADGFHNIETVFLPIDFCDILEINKSNTAEKVTFTTSGLTIPGDTSQNLCFKAYQLLKKDFEKLSHVNIHLHKLIPMGAGLGGGSANGAFVLSLLNKQFELNISQEQLISYALQLGSDCPFFIINKPCIGKMRGEVLSSVLLNELKDCFILIVNPGIHINTGWAFTNTKIALPITPIDTIIQQPISIWKENLKNSFEEIVFKEYPSIQSIKNDLYNSGALYASLTGTGSTVYGIFDATCNKQKIADKLPDNYFKHWTKAINL